jgi:hypothetical protein
LRSQVVKPSTNNTPVISSSLELGVPTGNSSLMAFVKPNPPFTNQSAEKPRQAGVGERLNLVG